MLPSAASTFKLVPLTPAPSNGANGEMASARYPVTWHEIIERRVKPVVTVVVTMTASILLTNAAAWLVLALALVIVR